MAVAPRRVVSVPVWAVRDPFWQTRTREVSMDEVVRRAEESDTLSCLLPVLADPLFAPLSTREEAEAEARRQLREADIMLELSETSCFPQVIIDKLKSHRERSFEQTSLALFRRGRPLPCLVLRDGGHRNQVVIGRATKAIREAREFPQMPGRSEWEVLDSSLYRLWVSVPDSLSDEQLRLWGVRPDNLADTVEGTEVAVSNCAATRLGSTANHYSHMKTAVSIGDRLFLVQSWWVGAHLDRKHGGKAEREADRPVLTVQRSYSLLIYAACVRSPLAMRDSLKSYCESGKEMVRQRVITELPSPFILLDETGCSIVKDAHDLVKCAVQTGTRSISRLIVAAILSARRLDDQVEARVIESRLLCVEAEGGDVNASTDKTVPTAVNFGTTANTAQDNLEARHMPSSTIVNPAVSFNSVDVAFCKRLDLRNLTCICAAIGAANTWMAGQSEIFYSETSSRFDVHPHEIALSVIASVQTIRVVDLRAPSLTRRKTGQPKIYMRDVPKKETLTRRVVEFVLHIWAAKRQTLLAIHGYDTLISNGTEPAASSPSGVALKSALTIIHGIELAVGISSTIFGTTVGELIDKSEVCFAFRSVEDNGTISVPSRFIAAAIQHEIVMRSAFFPSRFIRANSLRPQTKQLQPGVKDLPLSEDEVTALVEKNLCIEHFKAWESAYGSLSTAMGLLDSLCSDCVSDKNLALTSSELSSRREAMVSLVRTTITAVNRCRGEVGARYSVEAERSRKQAEAACARATNVWLGTDTISALSAGILGSQCERSSFWQSTAKESHPKSHLVLWDARIVALDAALEQDDAARRVERKRLTQQRRQDADSKRRRTTVDKTNERAKTRSASLVSPPNDTVLLALSAATSADVSKADTGRGAGRKQRSTRLKGRAGASNSGRGASKKTSKPRSNLLKRYVGDVASRPIREKLVPFQAVSKTVNEAGDGGGGVSGDGGVGGSGVGVGGGSDDGGVGGSDVGVGDGSDDGGENAGGGYGEGKDGDEGNSDGKECHSRGDDEKRRKKSDLQDAWASARDGWFVDTSARPPRPRILAAAIPERQARLDAMPALIPSTCRAWMYVSAAESRLITEEAANVANAALGGHGVPALYWQMEDRGYCLLEDAFAAGSARADISLVLDGTLERLSLPPLDPNMAGNLDPERYFLPIDNLGVGGRSMTDFSFWEGLEQSEDPADEELLRAAYRTLVRVAGIIELILKHGHKLDLGVGNVEVLCPNTAGRVLVTHPPTKAGEKPALLDGADPQRPHVDFQLDPKRSSDERYAPRSGLCLTPTWNTSAFSMVNGPVGAALRVFPGSHRWASTAPRIHKETAACSYPDLVWISPYTLFFMRGDCYHAGAAWAESKHFNDGHGVKLERDGKEDLRIARWHSYWICRGASLTNSVHFGQDADASTFPDPLTRIFPKIATPNLP